MNPIYLRLVVALGCLTSLLATDSARAQEHTRRGTLLGGLTGAIAGAAIGNQNDEAAAGALIGGVVGGLTGATIGSNVDQEQARARAYHQQQAVRLSRAVSTADAINMTRSGLGDAVIVNHIRENGVQRPLEVADVIFLHQQGVSEPVISAMQQARLATAPAAYPAPLVVERPHYVAPPVIVAPCGPPAYRYPHHHYYHHHPHTRHRPSSGVSWSVRIGR